MADPVNQVELPAYALPQRSETGRKFKDFVQRNNSTRCAKCSPEQLQQILSIGATMSASFG
jgi:hypothetical protein